MTKNLYVSIYNLITDQIGDHEDRMEDHLRMLDQADHTDPDDADYIQMVVGKIKKDREKINELKMMLEDFESQIEEPVSDPKPVKAESKPTRWKDAIRIEKEIDGCKGSAQVIWIEDDGFNAPHWSADIFIPWHDTKLVYLHADTKEEAIKKAGDQLEYALSRCTMI